MPECCQLGTIPACVSVRLTFALVLLAATISIALADVGVGDSRDTILAQYGKPTSIARRGDREIFLYPKGARIEFVDGKVVDVKGTLRPLATPAPAANTSTGPGNAASAANVTAPTSPPPVGTVAPPAPSPAQQPAAPKAGGAGAAAYNPAIAANELAKHVEKMDTAWGAMPPIPRERSVLNSIPSFLAGLLLRFLVTIAALKIAFKYWEMDAFWKGILLIAGIDLGVHAALELLGPVTSGLTTMTAVENGMAGLVLIFTINRFCFNKRIQNAVVTAAAVKTFVTLGYVFVGVAALNALFG